MRRSPAITVATLATAALALSACGRSTGAAASDDQAKDVSSGKATGTITVWAMGAEGDKLPTLAKQFESANPGAKVERHRDPVGRRARQVHHRHHGRQDPRRRHGRHHLDGRVRRPRRPRPDARRRSTRAAFFPGAQKTTEVNGTSYGIPWYVETRLVYYRTDLAKKAGYTTPPKDWEGLKAMAKAMQDKAGAKWGIGLQAGGDRARGRASCRSRGPTVPTSRKDGGKAYNFDTPEMQEAVKYYQSFFTDGISDKAAPATPDHRAGLRQRQGPDVHLRPVGDVGRREGRRQGLQGQVRRRADPGRRRRPPPSSAAPTSSVFKNSKQRDTAWKFVAVAVRPQDPGQVVPAVDRPALGQVARGRTRRSALTRSSPSFGEQLETAQAPPSFPTWEQVVAQFDSEMEKVTKQGSRPRGRAEVRAGAGRVDRDRPVAMTTTEHAPSRGDGTRPVGRHRRAAPAGAAGGRGGPPGSSRCRSACCSSPSRCGRWSSRSS